MPPSLCKINFECYSLSMRTLFKLPQLLNLAGLLFACSIFLGPQFAMAQGLSNNGVVLAARNTQTGMPDKEYTGLLKYLKNLEVRYFHHSYDHDPVEKRVERLELLIFGEARYGVFEERIKVLKEAVEKRDKAAAQKMKAQNEISKSSGVKTEYPILNTIEWRVLKKTYRKEGLDSRLERLEKKLLGQSSPAMSYADRIDRLKKIVGISVTSLPPKNPKLVPGPKPKADRYRVMTPFGKTMPEVNPFNRDIEKDFNEQMGKDLPTIMRYMNERMNRQLRGFFDSVPEFKESIPDGKVSPYVVPKKKKKVVVPPYADPNSI